ncbi:TPA: hypothetical protein U1X79_001222 [Streptococcus suis]|uniref:HeH/LEM domain-containing protein n=1 Tax=Streptococcus suis TaxID=1307 RepID=UPI0003F649A9|nr:HeH/LEM domain-containing protein [Streptococcus suis]MBO4130953.1 hypothetical protein [Streptococcus suis]MBO4133691.1 hypothetical protein [Streptococcus suis]NQK13254.1 hypothetical protein [Streptococcus suis]NQM24340.1 hypothetical protein [Streptococcus suis]HEM3555058.1 hypothetical protein [Streptococcus suis]
MNTYKDKKTGMTITTDCELRGDWELVKENTHPKTPTVPELKSMLTELGIEFNPKANKEELLQLYQESQNLNEEE